MHPTLSNCKYCQISVRNASIGDNLTFGPLIDEISVLSEASVSLDPELRLHLGTERTRCIDDANFVVLASMNSAQLSNYDSENDHLKDRALLFVRALILSGIPEFSRGIVINGGSSIYQVSDLPQFRKHSRALPALIDNRLVGKAVRVYGGLKTIFSEISIYPRIRAGLAAYHMGCVAPFLDERVHLFARAFQSILKPRVGRTEKDFTHRGQIIIGRTSRSCERLRTIYRLRSATEHLNDWRTALNISDDDATEKAFEMEMIASHAFAHILSSPNLLRSFQTDETIECFWEQPDAVKAEAWGGTLDVDSTLETRYRPRVLRRQWEEFGIE